MTKYIDHAILIPASPDIVWPLISQPESYPQWQADITGIRYLNARRNEPGMRWRYQHNRREMVAEMTAWYDGLGYEYVVVDGAPYQNQNKGRLRLQETAEGTVVQWTFSYETGGMLAGLRHSRLHGQLDRHIVNSLRNLYARIRDMGQFESVQPAKSLMRDAPDVEERSRYQPRHPSVLDDNQVPYSTSTAPADASADDLRYAPPAMRETSRPPIIEPPVADDDTRPNPAVQSDTPEIEEPAFLNDMPDQPEPATPESALSSEPEDDATFKPPQPEKAVVADDPPAPPDKRATDETFHGRP